MTTPPSGSGVSWRRWALTGGLVLGLAVVGGIVTDRNTQPQLISGPMVQIPEPGTLTIVWEMDAFFGSGAVRLLGPGGAERVEAATAAGQRYEATFRGLSPGTQYDYMVLNRGLFGREIVVDGPIPAATAPLRGTPFRFIAFGDTGVGSLSQEALAQRITAVRPDVVIHVGDLVYPAGALEDYLTNFFEPNAALIRSVPFMPCLGNHDCATDDGRPLLRVFVLPENGPEGIEVERHYWFDYGDARFVALDTDRETEKHGGVMTLELMETVVAPWLREVLTNCDARWKFVYFHHPFYTGSTHRASGGAYVKEAYVAVFEECGVDIVFWGHNHLYERTAPILQDAIVDEGAGVVYVTTGAGGAARYEEVLPAPDYIRVYEDRALSFTQVDVTADRLELKQIDDTGRVVDSYVMEKAPGAGGGMGG